MPYEPSQLSRYSEGPKSTEFCRFSMLHQFYAMQSAQILEQSHIIISFRVGICMGTWFHSGSQSYIWPDQRVTEYCELSFDISGPIPSALALADVHFLHTYRVLLTGVANILHEKSIYSGSPDKKSIHSSTPEKILHSNPRLPSSRYIWIIEVISPEPFQGMPRIASSPTKFNFL